MSRETVPAASKASDETTFHFSIFRSDGFKEENTKCTVCCDTKVKMKVPDGKGKGDDEREEG